MSVTIVAGAAIANGASNTTMTKPTGTAQNDILVGFFNSANASTFPTLPTGWTSLGTRQDTSVWTRIGYLVAGASEPGSYSWGAGTGSSFDIWSVVTTRAGAGGTLAIDDVLKAAGGTNLTTLTPASPTASRAGDALIMWWTDSADVTLTSWPSGVATRSDASQTANGVTCGIGTGLASGTTGTLTVTVASNAGDESAFAILITEIPAVVATSSGSQAHAAWPNPQRRTQRQSMFKTADMPGGVKTTDDLAGLITEFYGESNVAAPAPTTTRQYGEWPTQLMSRAMTRSTLTTKTPGKNQTGSTGVAADTLTEGLNRYFYGITNFPTLTFFRLITAVTVALLATLTRTISPVTAALQATLTRTISPVTAALQSTLTRTITPVTAALLATLTRTISPVTAALLATLTRTISPVTVALQATLTRTIGPVTAALQSTLTRTISAVTAALQSTLTRTISPVTAALRATLTRTISPVTVALQATLTRTISPVTAALLATLTRTINPVTATLQSTLTRTISPVTAALSGGALVRTISPVTAALIATLTRTISPVTAALQATLTRTISPVTAALQSTLTRTVSPVTAALLSTLTRTVTPVTAALRSTLSRTIASATAALLATQVRTITSVTVALVTGGGTPATATPPGLTGFAAVAGTTALVDITGMTTFAPVAPTGTTKLG